VSSASAAVGDRFRAFDLISRPMGGWSRLAAVPIGVVTVVERGSKSKSRRSA
jgi:hypothetical protein